MPAGVRVETATESADRGSEEIRDNLSFLQTFLLVFGFIAVFVGSFLIFNTFSITVAQRVTEFGMLRTLGASRRQILSSVMVEALAIGLLGALVGIAGGFLIALLLNALLEAFEIDLPTTSLVLESRTVVVSLLVGVVVTFVSSLIPALRSTRVPPIAALHAFAPTADAAAGGCSTLALLDPARPGRAGDGPDRPLRQRRRRRRGRADGRRRGRRSSSPSRSSARGWCRRWPTVAGWPLERLRRLTGRLARENAQRNPSRTAVTAAALMIGLALVAFVTVFAAGLKSSVAQVVDENFAGGLVIQNSDGFSPIPNGTATAAAQGARGRTGRDDPLGAGEAARRRRRRPRSSAPTRDIEQAVKVEWKQGGPAALRGLADDQAILSDSFASEHGLEVGDRFRLLSQTRRRPSFEVVGEFSSKLGVFGSVLITQAALAREFGQTQDTIDFVKTGAGRRRGHGPGAADERGRSRLPDRRSAEPAGTEGKPRKTGRPARQPLLRAARPGGRDLAVRDRQHAGALDPRTHPGAGDAAGDRDVAPPGADDDPLRGGDHGPDRGDPGDGAGGDLRGPDRAAAEGRRLHALLPGRLADRAAVLAALAGVLAAILPARRASRLDVLESLQYE